MTPCLDFFQAVPKTPEEGSGTKSISSPVEPEAEKVPLVANEPSVKAGPEKPDIQSVPKEPLTKPEPEKLGPVLTKPSLKAEPEKLEKPVDAAQVLKKEPTKAENVVRPTVGQSCDQPSESQPSTAPDASGEETCCEPLFSFFQPNHCCREPPTVMSTRLNKILCLSLPCIINNSQY